MLPHKAFERVLSTKRGHKLGEEEQLIIQAIRTVTNVKNRQTKAETAGMELLESKLVANPSILEDHKILLFLLAQGEIES